MNEERVFASFFVMFVVMLYVVGSVSLVVADEGSDRDRRGRDDDSDDNEFDDDSRVSAAGEGGSSGDSVDFRIRERVRIAGEDGVEREVEVRERIREDGRVERRIRIRDVEVELEDGLEVGDDDTDSDSDRTELRIRLSNGRNAEVKVMPDVASERALEALRLHVCTSDNNCTIILKDVGRDRETDTDSTDLRYELKAERRYRVFGLFERRGEVRAEVRADNGDVSDISRPWWSAFASEVDDSDSDVVAEDNSTQ